jgi:hypothetical protein
MFSKITSEFSEVTKRILIVLYIISIISTSIYLFVELRWHYRYEKGDVLFFLEVLSIPLIGYWIIVATINWIKKGAIE